MIKRNAPIWSLAFLIIALFAFGSAFADKPATPAKVETVKVELTPEEINVLVSALDAVTKQGGLQAAVVTLPLAIKLKQASP